MIIFLEKPWQTFSDPRFELQFKYPKITPGGSLVEVKEYGRDDEIQILFFSKDSEELYFEVSLIPNASARERYKVLQEVSKKHVDFYIGELKELRLVLVWKPYSGKAPGCFGIRLQGRKPLQSRFCLFLGE